MPYSCYLLTDGKTSYIGYTSQPIDKRLEQHNRKRPGGAKATAKFHGQGEIVGYVTGFASKSEAMQFEYAWKHSKPKAVGVEQRIQRAIKLIHDRPLTFVITLQYEMYKWL